MDALRKQKFNQAMFSKNRTLAIRVGKYQSSDIKEASFDYGYIKGDTYKPGGTCAGSAKIVFTSVITTFNKLDKIYPEIGLLVDGTYEWVKMGEYFINDIEIDRNRNTTKLDLMDGMFKLNREHVTDLTYPAEIRHVIKEICLKTGITLANEYMDITSMNYRIESIPKEKKMTFRDVLGLATQMLGMSCFFNREGKLEIKGLTDSGITITADSYFMHGLTKSEIEYQIAGISCKKNKEILTVGLRTGRSLEIENLLISQSTLDNLYHNIKDIRYYPFNLNYQGHLLLDVGQWVTIKTNTGETFKSPVLSQSFTFKGGLRGRISADSKAGNDAQYSYAGTITKKIEQFNEIEAQIQSQLEEADKNFDKKIEKIQNDFSDQVELAKAKTEEAKRELSDAINQHFDSFNNGPLQEAKRRAIEALQNAGASSLLAQEAKRIGLDSITKLEEFKRQATSAQTALSGDLDVLKRTVANDVRPKQAQAEAEIAKQVEALIQTKKELAGVKSAQATYEETTTRRLSELTNLANGKASKSELTQTAEQLASKIASVQASGRNLFLNSLFKQDISKTGIWTTSTYEATIDSTDKYLGHNALKIVGQNPSGRDGGNPKITYPALGQFGKVIPGSTTNQDVIITFYAKANKNGIMLRSRLGNINYKTGNVILSTEIKRYVVHIPKSWTNESKLTTNEWLFNFNQEGTVWIWMPKFEISDVDTSYSEAPEDIEGQISAVESNFRQRADALDAGVSRLTEGLRTKADISSLNVTAENIRQSVKSLETNTQNKLNQMLSLAEFEVRAGSIRQEILNATKDKADKTLVTAEAGKLRTELSTVQAYVNKDGQRQESLQRYARDESARQATTVRELVNRDFVGKSAYQEDVREIERRFSAISTQTNNDIATKIAQYKQTVDGQFANITSQIANKANQTDFQRVQETSRLYERILGNTDNGIANNVARMALTNQLFQIEVSKNEGLKTVQRQIAGSWAVQNINNEGDLISGINLGANGYNRFDGKLTHITGETLIDNAVIKSAMVDKLKTANFEAGSVTTVVLDAEAVTAEKLKVDQAFFNKLVANEAYLNQLFAKQAFINRVQSISINASQVKAGFLSGDRILGGTITGSSISGATLTGHTKIQLGTYGSFDAVDGGLQINVPRTVDSKDGLGVQFIGSYGRGTNVPYGLYVYKDSDLTTSGTWLDSDDFLITVNGYINAKGIGWLKTGQGSVNGKTTGTIGFWDSDNVSLSFGGSGNDIYYSYNGTAYSLWSVVDQHFSDRRLKENIVDCKHKALDYIQQFQFKEYDWKKQEDRPQKAHTRIGLIAQEVQTVDPTLVYENGDTLNLDNLRLTSIALKAIQELSQRIETLERKLA